jgi:hypothetical protein
VNNYNAIVNGGLAGKPQFFGTSTAEVVASTNDSNCCSWNGDYARSVSSASPWFRRGGHSGHGALAGAFNALSFTGGGDILGHRTILSGY